MINKEMLNMNERVISKMRFKERRRGGGGGINNLKAARTAFCLTAYILHYIHTAVF